MILMLALVGVVLGAVFGMKWFGNKMMNQYVDAMPLPTVTITALPAQNMDWPNQLESIGSFVPVNGTDVTTEAGGIVTALHFESGQSVQKGAPLITLDAAAERAELQRLKAVAELSALNRTRREKLFKLEAIAKSDYDAAISELTAARAAVDAQAAKLAQKEIRAPFAGELGIRRVNVGQYLTAGAPIVTLQALDPIDVDFSLPEQYLGAVEPGFAVKARVEALPDQDFAGQVLAVEPRVDAETRNYRLRARLPNPDRRLRPGQFARIHLKLPGARRVLVVPRTAINYDSYGSSVFVVQKKAVAADADADAPKSEAAAGAPAGPTSDLETIQRFVKLGDARGDYVAVVEGIKENEVVATSGLLKLRNQQPVLIDDKAVPKLSMDPKPAEG
jgi:membrane fusion protein (multidrug efflux system)